MSSAQRLDSSTKLRVAPPDLHLAVWPIRDAGWGAAGAILTVAGVALAVAWFAQHLVTGLVAALLLLASSWRWWVPVTFDFGPAGIVETMWGRQRRVPWSAIARWELRRQGVLLLPDHEASPLDPWRGRYIAWNQAREELLAILEFYLGDRASE